jgi:hypothetical protein
MTAGDGRVIVNRVPCSVAACIPGLGGRFMNDASQEHTKRFPEAIMPPYDIGGVNAEIPIFGGDIKIIQNDNVVAADKGRIFLRWFPTPRLSFETESVPWGADVEEATVELPEERLSLQALITNIGGKNYGCHGIVRSPLVKGSLCDCEHVVFYLANFRSFIGKIVRDRQTTPARSTASHRTHPQAILRQNIPSP